MLLEEIEEIECMHDYQIDEKRITYDYPAIDDNYWSFGERSRTSPMMFTETEVFLVPALKYEVAYDCMWNGHTGDRKSFSAAAPGDAKAPAAQVPGQSLLKPDLKMSMNQTNLMGILADPNSVLPMNARWNCALQTPPISDDEDMRPTQILKNLQSALSENELDDGDLSDYFKEDDPWDLLEDDLEEDLKPDLEELDIKPVLEELKKKEQEENQKRAYYAATDHSYHKGSSLLHSANLGIDTPSDSEEEIDVVSLGKEKFSITKSLAGALPTNPSTHDRRQLQRTMHSRFPQGVKTLLPVRRGPSAAPKPAAKPVTRGKRAAAPEPKPSRQYKRSKSQAKYKRRYRYSLDCEEPSDKRNLHNDMERQRRVDLRNLFSELRKQLPPDSKRAAKVQILRGAADVIAKEHLEEAEKMKVKERLWRRQDVLKRKVGQLREQLARQRKEQGF